MESIQIKETPDVALRHAANLLMDIASLLMTSGAHTARVIRNVARIASAFGYNVEISIFQLSIIMTVMDASEEGHHVTLIRKINPLSINFTIVSKISVLSWKALDKHFTVEQVRNEFTAIANTKRFALWQLIIMVSIANASFCRLFGGDFTGMALVALGTGLGVYTRHLMHHKGFSHYLIFICAAFVASIVAGLGVYFEWGGAPQIGLAASVLFLIPGVPLLNAVTDVINGHVLTGTARAINAGALILCISMGLLISMLILGLEKL